MTKFSAILFFLLFCAASFAQQTNFSAQAPGQVQVGQRFRLIFSINSEASNFIAPDINNFEVLQGPSYQTGSNIVNINGKIDYTYTTSYSFILEATRIGTFTIPSAVVTANGKRHISNPITITVVKQSASGQAPQNNAGKRDSDENSSIERTAKEMSIKAIIDKSNPYIGEPITITYKLYTPQNLSIGELKKTPSFQGFWAQNTLKNQTQYKQYTENLNGKRYMVAEIMQYSLIPQKSGLIVIDPIEQEVQFGVKVKARNSFSDDPFFNRFFGDAYSEQLVAKSIFSNPVSVNVKPLAESNPVNFSGAVGQLSIKTEIDKNQLNANDALVYKVTISGTGNLCLIEKPDIFFPPDFEVYDPKVTDNFKNASGTSGSRTFEFLLIPRNSGDFKIEPVQYTYFNLAKKDFVTITSNATEIKVLKGSGTESDATRQEAIKYINNDIRHLMSTPLGLFPTGRFFYGSFWFWFIFILLILAFLVFIFVLQRIRKDLGDNLLMQRRKATKVAVKRLKKAKLLLEASKHDAFHEEIALALWGYISHKFNIPLAELSMETARESLMKRNVDNQLAEKFLTSLSDCTFARYAPPGQAMNMTQLYEMAIQVITETEQQLK